MIIHSELDHPEDITVQCKLCGGEMRVTHYWIYDRWLHATVHERCINQWDKVHSKQKETERVIPARFEDTFDPQRANADAMRQAQSFSPDSELRTLALIGVPARGKSRIMWEVIKQFFDERGSGWVDYFLFEDLVSEFDRTQLNKLKISKHAFIDNIGAVESYGRERAGLQSVLRTRISKQHWTFMTIDNLNFDPGFETLLRDRAVMVVIDE